MSNEKNSPSDQLLSKEDLSKIVEDPYFQYLIKEKARTQTRAYLVLVSSVIVAVLAYAGLEFKSVRDLIEKEKGAIEKEKSAVLSISEKMRDTAGDVTAKKDEMAQAVGEAKSRLDGAKAFTEQSNLATGAMLAAARDNIVNSQEAQKRFYDQQKDLFSTIRTVNSEVSNAARAQLQDVDRKLAEVNKLATDTKMQVDLSEKQITAVLQKAGEVEKQGDTLSGLTSRATDLEKIQQRFLQGGIVGTIFIRSQQPQTIKMFDPHDPIKAENDWYITFRRFHLNDNTLRILGEAKKGIDGIVIPFDIGDIDARPSPHERPFHSLLRLGIPFRLQLNFAYHTKLSRDFVSLKIYGEEIIKEAAKED